VVASPFATAQSNSGDPEDGEDNSGDPQDVQCEARTRKDQDQKQQQKNKHCSPFKDWPI
jgi:hypothetical protein